MTSEQPLQISIHTTQDRRLVVSNNIQKKTGYVPSNKVGLNNIAFKYQLLAQEEIIVEDNGDVFTVSIPLIKNINRDPSLN